MMSVQPRTLFDKIWADHVVMEEPGSPAVLYIDLHLVHEVTSPQAFDGLRAYAREVARENGAIYLTGYAASKWEHTRYTEPYMREDLNDYGILIDTLEAGVTWDNLHRLHQGGIRRDLVHPGVVGFVEADQHVRILLPG